MLTCTCVTTYPTCAKCLIMSPSPRRYLRENDWRTSRLDCIIIHTWEDKYCNAQLHVHTDKNWSITVNTCICSTVCYMYINNCAISYIIQTNQKWNIKLPCTRYMYSTLIPEDGWKRHGSKLMSLVSFAWSKKSTKRRNFFSINWDRAIV